MKGATPAFKQKLFWRAVPCFSSFRAARGTRVNNHPTTRRLHRQQILGSPLASPRQTRTPPNPRRRLRLTGASTSRGWSTAGTARPT